MCLNEDIIRKISEGLTNASSKFSEDKINAYLKASIEERNENSKWIIEKILENSKIAKSDSTPLCDDTGIPHIVIDLGDDSCIDHELLESIKEGIKEGLRKLPGRPMAIKGDDRQRISQELGLFDESEKVELAPILIRQVKEHGIKVHIVMFGGGPEIRSKTYRIYHKHNVENVVDEVVEWASDSLPLLGCTPGTIAVGIGRTHYEATCRMIYAVLDGNYNSQSDIERDITEKLNNLNIGPLGLGGKCTVLGTFLNVGPQRASGVRIVCMRPCCCMEPRIATVNL